MINIVFCDDNEEFLKFFKGEIKSQFQAVSEGEPFSAEESFTNGKELLTYSDKNSIDVLFLDIDMPEMSGFEIAKVMNEKSNGKIIIVFMSAYDNFVYESFDYLPFAYMRKDSIATETTKVVLRITEKLSSKKKQIKLLCDKTERVFFADDIMYFESRKNYYEAHMTDGKIYSCRGTISKLENEVKPLGFFRTHNAFLVNLLHIERVDTNGYILVGEMSVPLSQKRAKEFRKAYLEYTRRSMGV